MPPHMLATEFQALRQTLASLRALINSFQLTLQSPSPTQVDQQPNPLRLLSDAAKLLKAQTTKLSLMILNKPFSPKEVTFILNTLLQSVLPALLTGLQVCPAEKYTKVLHEHVRALLRVLWKEMLSLLLCVPEDDQGIQETDGKPTLTSTGVVWEQCDALIELGEKGLVWLLDCKAREYGELLEDAIAELDDWDPDEDEETDEEDEDGVQTKARETINTPTTSDEERLGEGILRMSISPQSEQKTRILKHLRLIKLLYPALRKRRIATFPNLNSQVELVSNSNILKLDKLVYYTQQFMEHADELAGYLYANANEDVAAGLRDLTKDAVSCIELVRKAWNNQEDEFTAWSAKWKHRFEELDEQR